MVGFRTPNGKLTTVQSFKTMQIPRMVRDKPGAWDPSICLDWGQRFLTFLKSVTCVDEDQINDSTSRVWRVKFIPQMGVTLWLLNDEEVSQVTSGEEERSNGFLPNWYWDELQKDVAILRKQTSKRDRLAISGDCRNESAVVLPPG